MQRPHRWMRGALAHAALAFAGAVAAWAASPVGPNWIADPEEQFLLDVDDGFVAHTTTKATPA